MVAIPKSVKFVLLALVSAGLLGSLREELYFDPVSYTAHFADEVAHLGIPNFWNVVTNLGFLLIGAHGLRHLGRVPETLRSLARVFLLALVGTAFGSAYFHWETTPFTLFWDQLPMSIGFGSFVGIVIADRFDLRFGRVVGLLLCLLGPWSVWNIYYGGGSTTPYLVLQFGSLIFSALLLLGMPQGQLKRGPIFIGIAAYAAAKIFESHDFEIFQRLGFISGHSLKHIAAALAVLAIFRGMEKAKH